MVRGCAADGLAELSEPIGYTGARDLGDGADRLRRDGWRCCSPFIPTAKRGRPAGLTAKKECGLGGLRLKANRPQPRALRHRIGPSLRVEFVEQRGDVKLYRMDRNLKAPRDRLVRRALGDQRQHVEFAGR